MLSTGIITLAAGDPTAGTNVSTALAFTNAAQVRALTPTQAAQRYPVRLRGVIIDCDPSHAQFSMVDDTAGIYAEGPVSLVSELSPGDLVEAEGVSDPGKFAPYMDVRFVRKLGNGKIPEPKLANVDDLISGQLDAQWIEVVGVVRHFNVSPNDLSMDVQLANGSGRILAHRNRVARDVAVDDEVRLRGVCYYQFNKARQAVRPYLAIPSIEPIRIQKIAVTNLNDLPLVSIGSLMQFNIGETYAHRIRVRGLAIYSQPDEGFWIHDATRGIRVAAQGKNLPEVGAEVDVFGFIKRGDYGPIIEDAIFSNTGKTSSVSAIHLSKADEALDHDSDVVECEAVILEQLSTLDGCRLKLADGKTEFPAILRIPNRALLPQWPTGTRVRIAGVCSVSFLTTPTGAGTIEPQTFQLLLRSTTDVQVLQFPSWWNSRHSALVLAGIVVVLLFVVGATLWLGHRRLRAEALQRMKSEAEFSAILNERNRLARELHDTLAQGLGAISLQLEVAKRQLPPDSNAREPVEEAGTQTRTSLQEVRNAIWNMRSQVLETGDLVTALQGIVRSLTEHTAVKSEVRVTGKPRRFAPMLENNLLRIGQEAITNAAKHAGADKIEVVLKFDNQQFEMTVSDTGCGFDPTNPPASAGGFGLKGMCERAAGVNGRIEVESAPGKGCTVKLIVPVSAS